MLNQINSEWIKVRSVRSTVFMFIVAVVLSALFAGLGQIAADADVPADSIFLGILFSQIFFMVLGIQIIGQEYRFNTIRATFAATPNRVKVIIAKLLVLVTTVFVTTLLLLALSVLTAFIVLNIQGFTIDFSHPDTPRFIAGVVATSIFISIFGFAVGSIIKQPIASIVLALVYALIIENIIMGIFLLLEVDYYKWLPLMALSSLTTISSEQDFGGSADILSVQTGYLYSIVLFGSLVAIGAVFIKIRDA